MAELKQGLLLTCSFEAEDDGRIDDVTALPLDEVLHESIENYAYARTAMVPPLGPDDPIPTDFRLDKAEAGWGFDYHGVFMWQHQDRETAEKMMEEFFK